MPIYEYQAVSKGCETCLARLQAMQAIGDPPITSCPDCDAPVQRVVSAVSFKLGSERQQLSRENVGQKGFTRYERTGDGHYERTAGDGPKTLERPKEPPQGG